MTSYGKFTLSFFISAYFSAIHGTIFCTNKKWNAKGEMTMPLKNTWNHMNLTHKILSIFLPLIILPMMLVSIFSVSMSVKNGKNDAINNATDKLSLVTNQTEQLLSHIKYNIKAFSISSALQDAISSNYADNTYGNYMLSSSLHNAVYNVLDISKFISSGYIHTFDGRIYNVKTGKIDTPTREMSAHYDYVTSQKGKILFSLPRNNFTDSAVNISKSLIEIETGKCLGIFSFDIKESLFYDTYDSVSNTDTERFFITDGDGIVISSDVRTEFLKPLPDAIWTSVQNHSSHATISGKRRLILSSKTPTEKYNTIYIMSYDNIYKDALAVALLPLSIGIGTLLIAILLTNIFTKNLVRPIIQLANYADEAGKGNFLPPIHTESRDEIGFLTERFFNMNQNIHKLTTSIYNEQNQKREYELRLLQSQINPHFLYNCLDSISSLIADQQNETANNMVYHLGKYYRTILSKGRNIITIQEEISLICDYLEIQLIKFPDLFTYEIDVQSSVLESQTLKMVIQPIVENSILHGFAGYKNGRKIIIKGFCRNNNICFEISDNGRGISPEIRKNIFSEAAALMPQHFGLKNIQERIQLKFGRQFGLKIESEPGCGTTVRLIFPLIL